MTLNGRLWETAFADGLIMWKVELFGQKGYDFFIFILYSIRWYLFSVVNITKLYFCFFHSHISFIFFIHSFVHQIFTTLFQLWK